MTFQVREILHFGKLSSTPISMTTEPLKPYLAARGATEIRNMFLSHSGFWDSSCDRGYVGEWRISRNHLWLVGISSNKKVPLSAVFPVQDDQPILATWFTGVLRLEMEVRERDVLGNPIKVDTQKIQVKCGVVVDMLNDLNTEVHASWR